MTNSTTDGSTLDSEMKIGLVLSILAVLTLANSFYNKPFLWVRDGMRYFANGISVAENSRPVNKIAPYNSAVKPDEFEIKKMKYPCQLYQLFIGTLSKTTGLDKQYSIVVYANMIPFIVCFLLLYWIFKMKCSQIDSLILTAALSTPLFSFSTYYLTHFAVESWMMMFILITVYALLNNQFLLAGVALATGYFFRAQMFQYALVCMIVTLCSKNRKKALVLFLSIAGTYVFINFLLKAQGSFHNDSGYYFYYKAFVRKFDIGKGLADVFINYVNYAPIFMNVVILAVLKKIRQKHNISIQTQKCFRLYSVFIIILALFTFIMACTRSTDVTLRYFCYLPILLWICFWFMLSDLVDFTKFNDISLYRKLILTCLIMYPLIYFNYNNTFAHIHSEDIAVEEFANISEDQIVLCKNAGPEVFIKTRNEKIMKLPDYDTFRRNNNQYISHVIFESYQNRFDRDYIANNWLSMIHKGYFEDDYGNLFIRKKTILTGLRRFEVFSKEEK